MTLRATQRAHLNVGGAWGRHPKGGREAGQVTESAAVERGAQPVHLGDPAVGGERAVPARPQGKGLRNGNHIPKQHCSAGGFGCRARDVL